MIDNGRHIESAMTMALDAVNAAHATLEDLQHTLVGGHVLRTLGIASILDEQVADLQAALRVLRLARDRR